MGALFLKLLRAVMGDKALYAGIKQYVKEFRGRPAELCYWIGRNPCAGRVVEGR